MSCQDTVSLQILILLHSGLVSTTERVKESKVVTVQRTGKELIVKFHNVRMEDLKTNSQMEVVMEIVCVHLESLDPSARLVSSL